MLKINKSKAPNDLLRFNKVNSRAQYKAIPQALRQVIRSSCTQDQFYLCGYCTRRISGFLPDTINEHVMPQQRAPKRSLDYDNIIARCNTPD